MSRARVTLLPGRDRSVREGHPWIFSGSVAASEVVAGAGSDPALAEVHSAGGEPLGVGFYNPASRIRVRLLSADVRANVDSAFFRERLEAAARLRAPHLPPRTTGYRLLNAEGDGVPGWTIDRFGDVLVSQITAAGLERLRGEAYEALRARYPECSILHLGDFGARKEEKLPLVNEAIAGAVPGEVDFEEAGIRLSAELASGQKTGFYCDQRENRRRAGALAGGRRVLDLFAHSGAFAAHALAGGAAHVALVESAPRLVERAKRTLDANGFDDARSELVTADVFEDLRRRESLYDLVVCDPPPMARRKEHLDRAARAYKDLNRLALTRLAPGGLFFTFSCSGAVDAKLFRQILFAAATEARVDLALLEPLAAGPDHPVSIFHPQGEYLKGWLAVSRGRRA